MPFPPADRIVYAACTTSVQTAQGRFTLVEGDPWDAADPLVVARPELFADVCPFPRRTVRPVEGPVEQATRTPGERRTIRRG